jgi:nicotinate-nucleotide pyrophosphorylase (carboxylating)
MHLDNKKIQLLVKQALVEDRYSSDITTKGLDLGRLKIKAALRAKQNGVCAGIKIACEVFSLVDKTIAFRVIKKDGLEFKIGDDLAVVSGYAKSILVAERTAINFLSKLSGIATLTREFVDKIKPCRAKILDTRKTTPGLRLLEKYAVRMGGGYNHRLDLSEAILIKDNHIAVLRNINKNINLGRVVDRLRRKYKNKEIDVEVNSIREFKEVLNSSVNIIMLDNMSASQIKECVRFRDRINKKAQLEVSGNVNLVNVKALARLGVDRISIGKLTHSPKAVDISLEVIS